MQNNSSPSVLTRFHVLHVQQGERHHPSCVHHFGSSRPPLTPAIPQQLKKRQTETSEIHKITQMEGMLISHLNLDLSW